PEIAAQRLQRVALAVDLAGGAEAEPAQDRHGRTPALDRVLQQEAGHHEWQEQRAARAARRGKDSGQGERGRVRLDGALDVPFAIEFREARGNLSAVLGKIEQVALDLAVDAAV